MLMNSGLRERRAYFELIAGFSSSSSIWLFDFRFDRTRSFLLEMEGKYTSFVWPWNTVFAAHNTLLCMLPWWFLSWIVGIGPLRVLEQSYLRVIDEWMLILRLVSDSGSFFHKLCDGNKNEGKNTLWSNKRSRNKYIHKDCVRWSTCS